MEIVNKFIPEMTIGEFADQHNLVMEVSERRVPVDSPNRYYAHFKDAEISEGNFLRGAYGDGSTPEEAIDEYAKEISTKRLIVGAYSPHRSEYDVPRLKLTPR